MDKNNLFSDMLCYTYPDCVRNTNFAPSFSICYKHSIGGFKMSRGKQTRIMILLFIGVLMGALDISIVGPSIPSIEKTMQIAQHDLSWIFSIYILFNLVGISLMARLSD